MSVITSRQHPLVQQCRAILRGDDDHLLLDGWHLAGDALAAGIPLTWVAIDAGRSVADSSIVERAAGSGARIVSVSGAVLEAMSPVRSSSGIVAVGERPAIDPRAILAPAPPLVVAGLGVQDPGNVGALIRSADAGGATGVLLDDTAADPWGWKALRASMGSGFRLPVLRDADAVARLHAWQGDGIRIIAADAGDGISMYAADLAGPLAIVMGGEGGGLPPAVLDLADLRVRVPMRPRVESLNVAVAAALLIYEAARRRA